jgi:hypothetical protein
MSDETTTLNADGSTTASGPIIPDVVTTPEEDAAAAAALEPPAPEPPAELEAEESPAPARVTTLLRLACGHVFGTDVPVATYHHCDVHDATFPVVSAHAVPTA